MKELLRHTQQDRSRATQDRILKATARLLRKDTFESISIRRIVEEADTSIGSFYARFRDKEALLRVLYAENEQKLDAQIERLRSAVSTVDSLSDVADVIADHLVVRYGESPNLSRALFEYSTREPNSREAQELSAQRKTQYRFLRDALHEFEDQISHPDPPRAIEIGLYFIAVTCRNRLFYPLMPQARTLDISKDELRGELSRLLVGYLTC